MIQKRGMLLNVLFHANGVVAHRRGCMMNATEKPTCDVHAYLLMRAWILADARGDSAET